MWNQLFASALLVLGTTPLLAQEQVQVDLPAQVDLEGAAIGRVFEPSRPVALSFNQALLGRGRSLRFSVRLEGACADCRVLFTTGNVRGGIGRSGRVDAAGFVPVFESFSEVLSGGLEVSWMLETSGEARHAGKRQATLRWRIESVPTPEWMEHGGGAAGAGPPSPGAAGPSAGATVPGRRTPFVREREETGREQRRRPPAEEV
jgi:hypothetical protein